MQLILSYFDEIKGPSMFVAFPRELVQDDLITVSNFMMLQSPSNFFQYTSTEPAKKKYFYNLRFHIPSHKFRGGTILAQLTSIFQMNIDPAFIQSQFTQLAEFIMKIAEIESLFLSQNESNLSTLEYPHPIYNQLYSLVENSYLQLVHKEQEFDILNRLFLQSNLTTESSPALVSKTLARAFISSIDISVPNGREILFTIGQTLAQKFSPLFTGEELDGLLTEISNFWKKNAFGIVDDVKSTPAGYEFKVYDCFECAHLPNIGRPVCKFDEGLLSTLFTQKLQHRYEVKETECYGQGYDHCCFTVAKKDKN